MCKPHAKRVQLNCPDWLKSEWATGDKNNMADLLMSVNFDKDCSSLRCIQDNINYIYCVFYWSCSFLFLHGLYDTHDRFIFI